MFVKQNKLIDKVVSVHETDEEVKEGRARDEDEEGPPQDSQDY